jgi:glycosyltransferase involved in cell wall biosynthesis
MRTSFDSLFETTKNLPVEIIVVNNSPENTFDHDFFTDLLKKGKIVSYILNSRNMSFGFARNQAIGMAHGNYFCIVDNDILYQEGWLEACWKVLEAYPGNKIYATPVEYPTGFLKERYDSGKLDVEGVEYNLNMRAGSNCFVIRKKDFYAIGQFLCHRIAGSKWTDRAVKLDYLAAVAPGGLVKDMGLRAGYMHTEAIPIKRILRNGQEIVFNVDEYGIV